MRIYKTSIRYTDTYVFRAESLQDMRRTMDAVPVHAMYNKNVDNLADNFSEFAPVTIAKRDNGRFGEPSKVDLHEMSTTGISAFIDTKLLNDLHSKLNSLVPSSVTSKFKKKKFKFNRNFGVFSFDRASAGLFWLDEFYCEAEGRAVHESETQLDLIGAAGGKLQYSRFTKAGYYPVTEIKADHFEDFPNSPLPLIGRKEARADGTPFVRTTVEDVFVYFPQKAKQDNSVLLCVNIGGGYSQTWQEMAYSGLAAGILADLFSRAGVKVAIHGFFGTKNCLEGGRHSQSKVSHRYSATPADPDSIMIPVIPLKNFKDTLDINAIALYADSRFIRYENYRNRFFLADILGRTCKKTLGHFFDDGSLQLEQTDYFKDDKEMADATRLHIQPMDSEAAVIRYVTSIAQMVNFP